MHDCLYKTLYPGTLDYMEKFVDDQEVGRDSPNYHSLAEGDIQKKIDNGSNERFESGSAPGVAGLQVH